MSRTIQNYIDFKLAIFNAQMNIYYLGAGAFALNVTLSLVTFSINIGVLPLFTPEILTLLYLVVEFVHGGVHAFWYVLLADDSPIKFGFSPNGCTSRYDKLS